ncbi:MAG TPA: phosphoribosyl-ATP diphosphatase [Planctomycetaceae bacterium]|nr:phosphoribosyl-ATP diphosphatase [Planctomycetaceae bacterium]
MTDAPSILRQLAAVLESRKRLRPAGSYTVELLDAGHATITSKIVEEAYELIAAAGEDEGDIAHEAADLVYHILVLLTAADVSWDDVERELQTRFGISGLEERALRPKAAP